MVLGCNYLTKFKAGDHGEGRVFGSPVEVEAVYQRREISLHARIKVRGINRIIESELSAQDNGDPTKWKDWTTVGRVLFNQVVPQELGYVNTMMGKKELAELTDRSFRALGHSQTVKLLDDLKQIPSVSAMRPGRRRRFHLHSGHDRSCSKRKIGL